MNDRFRTALPLLAVVLAATAVARAQSGPETGTPELADRIVAVVNEDPILSSDLDRTIGLGLVAPLDEETPEAFRRRVLDLLIEEKLRFQELDRYGFVQTPLAQVERQVAELEERLGGRQALAERLEALGVDRQGLRQLVARQLMVMIFVEERLGPRVFVESDEIEAYFREVLVPEMRAAGQEPPALDAVREQIRQVIKSQRLNEEIDRWTRELKREADVEDYFDDPPEAPPGEVVGAVAPADEGRSGAVRSP